MLKLYGKSGNSYGKVGELVEITDDYGHELHIGDVVALFDKDGEYLADVAICADLEDPKGFVMGAGNESFRKMMRFSFKFKSPYTERYDGEIIDDNIVVVGE